jgi:rod shape-determining protein MreB
MHLPLGPRPLVAVDLGTANTKVYVHGRGIVLFEPSVIAIDEPSGDVLAVGDDARLMIGRTPSSIRATRPLRSGVITDLDVTEQMLRLFLHKAVESRFTAPRVMLCIPGGVTTVERRAVEEATLAAGSAVVYLIEEAMAAAIGADLPVSDASARMVVDIGGGTSEVAVISLGGMVVTRSLRVGGYDMDEAIVRMARQRHGLTIGEETAERAKLAIGSALPVCETEIFEVRGRQGMSGMLRAVEITGAEVREALAATTDRILGAIVSALEETPPELASDLVRNGIVLAGGGCLLHGFRERVEQHTHLPVEIAADPLMCVAVGAGRSLEEVSALQGRSRRWWRAR